MTITFAEKRKERYSDSDAYTMRYLVYNGDTIGSYGVDYDKYGRAYAASRDYHALAPANAEALYQRYREWVDSEDDDAPFPKGCSNIQPLPCCYHDNKLSICDGSSLVEVITDNDESSISADERCFAIAAMMAH